MGKEKERKGERKILRRVDEGKRKRREVKKGE